MGESDEAPAPFPATQIFYAFLLGFPMMAIGAILTFANSAPFRWYALSSRIIPTFSALEDQQLGGLTMWLLGGLSYWPVASVAFVRWMRRADPESRNAVALPTSAR